MMTMNILIIDNEAVMRKSIKRIVANTFSEHNVFEAASTEEALIMMEWDHMDIVFIDITMPRMDGLTFIENYGYRFPDTRWIAITDKNNYCLSHLRKAMRLKVTDCLLKPFGKSELRDILDTLIRPD
ncbi:response regulator transcription factor [Paenibacillus macerans]|uniref:response regulator transcription factor n=1 Tax=Paenibacillus macerans TaxID=44252 RepID=UPI00203C2E31|nr:response regulator [Paenibacillus macerans]MCM3699649.1 response regulator [Paenibacillus macerans]